MNHGNYKLSFLFCLAVSLGGCGGNSDGTYEPSPSYDSYSAEDYSEDATNEQAKPDGDYDCTATNISRGNGPYTLDCEKDGGDVTIHFNNGGHITVDEDGYDSNSVENWDVELE